MTAVTEGCDSRSDLSWPGPKNQLLRNGEFDVFVMAPQRWLGLKHFVMKDSQN